MSDESWQQPRRRRSVASRSGRLVHQTSYILHHPFRLDFLARHATVRLEDAGRRKLAELVTHHVLGDVHGNERLAVMHTERVANEIRCNRGSAGPRLDWLLGASLCRLLDFLKQVVIDEETFFNGTCHGTERGGLLLVAGLAAVMVDNDHAGR